ncbi:MAG: ABC transporter ATP-binding protein [Acidobacteriota bacterium]
MLIETRGLTKRYGDRIAVDQVSLQVQRGDIFGFLGQNGSGKSTTIRMLLGLAAPSAGEIRLRGFSMPRERELALSKVGAIVEAPAFYGHLTGWENLVVFSSLSGTVLPGSIHSVLRQVHLTGRERDPVQVYSHGMRQRLGLAQALLPKPELLVLDEPTDGLDPQGIREIRELLLDLAHKQQITIFLSSHLLYEVERICNRIAIIDNGQLLYQGAVSDLLHSRPRWMIRLDRPEEALRLLATLPGLQATFNGDGSLHCQMDEQLIPEVNRSLVSQGFRVYEIARHRPSLEELYFQLTSCSRSRS